ncbi:hypothetical protein [Dyadobacter arcticus]|uniref:Lipoprotein n=1 Tax=Dyadobacter arcticus TaxID=1078754 RepID=A0ABX0UN79_9BACT|nr:hypothetical protein [Dyadobacter arcticus]NIJ53439.1 hypothetical protein [Dyadobacter arcticus]
MKHCSLLILLVVFACNQQKNSEQSGDQSMTVVNDTISPIRNKVASGPVASFSEKVKDPLNDWRFAVELYETKATFDFLVKIKYKELDAEDTLKIPNFGIQPKVEIQKGPGEQSCILGFLDKKGVFKEYKMVQVKNQQLKISTLRHYARTRYKVKK